MSETAPFHILFLNVTLIAFDLKGGIEKLEEITGETSADDF
jgi:hypothetical protein